MKKYLFFIGIGIIFAGCASKHPCLDKKEECLKSCERVYNSGVELGMCKAGCYSAYATCKAKRKLKEFE